ncbi:hypothetical protein BD779DRAFT_1669880 [Infundibulicybe gibba]|nr:hypothetical protein BD779DRAFT_1669880 [Infundibulicybe gibba]
MGSIATKLPQELTDHIIDHLHSDFSSLKSCSLVCRKWLPTSRYHIFHKISLKVPPGAPSNSPGHAAPTRCKRLCRLLLLSPEIIPHIHELEIGEGSPNLSLSQRSDSKSTQWVTSDRSLPRLLSMLTSVKQIDFSSHSTLNWHDMSPALQKAIRHLFRLPSLCFIRLRLWSFSSFSDFASLISGCTNLKGLALSCISLGGTDYEGETNLDTINRSVDKVAIIEEEIVSNSDAQTPTLDFLTLDFVDFKFLIKWLLNSRSRLDVTALRELRVAHSHDAITLDELLQSVGDSLEHLHLKPGPWMVHPFNLAHNPNLNSLRITLEDPTTALEWTTTLLPSIAASHTLERIAVEFYIDLKKTADATGWAALDSAFSRCDSLRRVEIGLFAHPGSPDFIKVKQSLKLAGGRGIVQFYQLGIKNQRSSSELTPRISRFEC